MDTETITHDLLTLAKEKGVDPAPYCHNHAFGRNGRYLVYWQKESVMCYRLQGPIVDLPTEYKNSPTAFQGMWTEAGTVDSLEQAFALLKAWILELKEVDELPKRSVRRNGISGV